MNRSLLTRLALVFAAALTLHGVLQATWFRADTSLSDSWFHARWSWMLITGATPWDGLTFPHMAHSAYADRPFDWSLGWHWVTAPFTLLTDEPIDGLRIGCVVLNALLSTVFYGVLAAGGCRRPLLWTVLLHVGAPYFLFRAHMCRPTPFAITGLLLMWHFATTRRHWALGITTACTLLAYQVPAWPLAVCGVTTASVWIADRRVPWKLGLCAAGGIVAGFVLHPGFWDVQGGPLSTDRGTFAFLRLVADSLTFASDGSGPGRAAATAAAGPYGGRYYFADGTWLSAPIPQEIYAPKIGVFLREYPLIAVATITAVVAAILPKRSVRATSATALAVLACVLSLRSGRFTEYWAPLTALAVAEGLDGAQRLPSAVRAGFTYAALAVGLLLDVEALRACRAETQDTRRRDIAPAVAEIEKRAAPGDVVWNGAWDEFANLFYETRRVRFIQGFDPWYLIAHDPEDHRAMGTIRLLESTDAAMRDALVRRFGARFALIWIRPMPDGSRNGDYFPLVARLRRAPFARIVWQSEAAILFELR